ncbi:MAG: slipin family protein [Chloroflexi bacterium]|nr:slipin family protein [Chloroflexota bacterium]
MTEIQLYTLLFFVLTLVLLAAIYVVPSIASVPVLEHERGLFYRNGKFVRVLLPGRHWYWRRLDHIVRLDMRARWASIAGQELLTADNISVKLSLAASYAIADPYKAVQSTASYEQSLHLMLQLILRDLVGAQNVDDLLAQRKTIGDALLAAAQPQAAAIGLALETVGIKDVMFPGELKNIFAQVVNARKEGQAALERARGESAALRNLANTAKLLENNPALLQLRLLQALNTGSGHTIVLKLPGDGDDNILRPATTGDSP